MVKYNFSDFFFYAKTHYNIVLYPTVQTVGSIRFLKCFRMKNYIQNECYEMLIQLKITVWVYFKMYFIPVIKAVFSA